MIWQQVKNSCISKITSKASKSVKQFFSGFWEKWWNMKHLMDANDDNSLVWTKTIKLVFAAFPLSMQYSGVRATTGFLRIRFMSSSEAICLLDDCFRSLLLLLNTACLTEKQQIPIL
jgi:hypothetical protein